LVYIIRKKNKSQSITSLSGVNKLNIRRRDKMFIGNEEHYEKVREERRKLGLEIRGIRQIDIENSKYLNTYITDKTNGRTYLVERDYKEYWSCGFGWFKVMLLNCNNSHRVIWYENINNDDKIVIDNTERNRIIFDL
jgi:hypothetical protein